MTNKISRQDKKRLIENTLSLFSIQFFLLLIPLLTLPYLVRVLGYEQYGVIVFASTLVSFFISITDYSFKITATRETVEHRTNILELSKIFTEIQTIKSIMMLASIIIINSLVFSYSIFQENAFIFFITSLGLIGHATLPDWFFQGMEKPIILASINCGIKLLSIFFIFILINDKNDAWIYPLITSLSQILISIAANLVIFLKYRVRFVTIRCKDLADKLRDCFPIFINQFMPNLYNNLGGFILGVLSSSESLGIYDAIKKIIEIALAVISVISRVAFPFLNRKQDSYEDYKRIMYILTLGMMLTILIFNMLILNLLNLTPDEGFDILFVLTIGILFVGQYNIYGLNYLIIKKQDKLVMNNTIKASLCGACLSIPMIYLLGNLGAALNLTSTRAVMGLGLYFKYLEVRNAP